MTRPEESRPERERLRKLWTHIESGAPGAYTTIVVPSLSFDQDELDKIQGIQFYEERLLFSLLRLQDRRARVIFVSSLAPDAAVLDYYLGLLPGGTRRGVERRLSLLSAHDAGRRPLTEKILKRPRLLERIRRLMGDPAQAMLTCFNVTSLEQDLARTLGVSLNGSDPELGWIGTKTGSRRIFAEAGVPTGVGVTGVKTRSDVVEALDRVATSVPGIRGAVIKLDESFAGAGNALFHYPLPLPSQPEERRSVLEGALNQIQPTAGESPDQYLDKLERMGGIVEQFLDGPGDKPLPSPSVQLRINPDGSVHVLSTHDQVLAGPIGQTYVGCRFPAATMHRPALLLHGSAIGRVLADYGVIGRCAVDFVCGAGGEEGAHAIEINLRMGGTTFPFLAMASLVPGSVDPEGGDFLSVDGKTKHYFATDNLRSPAYQGLSPEDFFEIVDEHRLVFEPSTRTGPIFHMIGALSEFGRIGVVCIADSAEAAQAIYTSVVETLDAECPSDPQAWAPPTHPMGLPISILD